MNTVGVLFVCLFLLLQIYSMQMRYQCEGATEVLRRMEPEDQLTGLHQCSQLLKPAFVFPYLPLPLLTSNTLKHCYWEIFMCLSIYSANSTDFKFKGEQSSFVFCFFVICSVLLFSNLVSIHKIQFFKWKNMVFWTAVSNRSKYQEKVCSFS